MNLLIQAGNKFDLEDVFQLAKSGEHVNSMPFAGIVTLVDTPSNDPPHGAQGHRILVTRASAEKKLHTLVGQGINYSPDLSRHQAQRKVGVITDAWLDGNAVKVKGVIWKRDFPEAEKDLKGQALGMSMELANVHVDDINADVWTLDDFTFTGATILQNSKAAYHRTALAASKEESINNRKFQTAEAALKHGGHTMDKTKKKAAVNDVQILASAIGAQIADSLKTVINGLGDTVKQSMAEFRSEIVGHLEASAEEDPQEAAVAQLQSILAGKDEEEVDAAKKEDEDDMDASKKDDDEDDMDASKKDDDDEDDMDASLEEMNDEDPDEDADDPGHINKNAKNKGRKTQVTHSNIDSGMDPVKLPNLRSKKMKAGKVNAGSDAVVQAMAAASVEIRTLRAQNANLAKLQNKVRKQENIIKKMEAQQDRFTEALDRRTLPAEASALLAKAGYSATSLQSEGRKLTVGIVDQIIAEAAPNLHPQEKMAFKNLFLQYGIMEDGVVDRGFRLQ